MEKFKSVTKNKLENLPKTAGVYLFYSNKKLIYIGKAINIRDRVKNHFNQPSYRDNLFIENVSRIGFIETASEIEALVLEASLIKKHLPKFNVVWRDDKNYFYVAIAQNQNKVPHVYITHQFKIQNSKFKIQHIGPFIEGSSLKKTLKFLRRVFPYYTSPKHPKTTCTWCHLDLCPGPNPDVKEYKKNIQKLILILQGKRKNVLSSLKKEMMVFSKANKFEGAQKVRDRIYSLENIMAHAHILESQNANFKMQHWDSTEKALSNILYGVGDHTISRIECYDISNIQGKSATGSMVVFTNGNLDKSEYKKFKIRLKQEPNDIAMLKEVLTRRFFHPEWQYPEVILIDGGRAQLNVTIKTKPLNSHIKAISIAKGRQELFVEDRKQPIPLKALPQGVYNLIKHLDDEAHRFAISYHKKLRKKALLDI